MKSKDNHIEACAYDPTLMIGIPVGMFHCPECGEMVIAGLPHPDYSLLLTDTEETLVDDGPQGTTQVRSGI